jgi:hypothetical protein
MCACISAHAILTAPFVVATQEYPLFRTLSLAGQSIGSFEIRLLDVFWQYFNNLTPVAPTTVLRKALCIQLNTYYPTEHPVGSNSRSSVVTEPTDSDYAALTTLWACVAAGAAMVRSPLASDYYGVAREYLSRCYDLPCYETLCGLAATAIAAYYIEPGCFAQYANFAMIIYRELRSTLSDLDAAQLRVAMGYLRCTLESQPPQPGRIDKPGSLDEQLHQYAQCGVIELPELDTFNNPCQDADCKRLSTLYNCIGTLWLCFFQALDQSPGNFAEQALARLTLECSRLRSEGFYDQICNVRWLYAHFAILASCMLGKFDEATREANCMLDTINTFPHFATVHRKGSVIHIALVSVRGSNVLCLQGSWFSRD